MRTEPEDKLALCYNSAMSKMAVDPVLLDVRGISDLADAFMIVSGSSNRQIKAIVDAIEDALRESGDKDYHIEGYEQGWWVLIDAGDVVIHVFSDEARAYYGLESHWNDAKRLSLGGQTNIFMK